MAARDFFSRSIFSCFTDKRNTLSAQPASSEKDLTSVNDNSRTFVRETHTVDSRHAGSCSATATPLPNDIQSHGSHPSSRLGASSPQSIAHERGFQIGSSSTTSSLCDTNKLDHAENIHEPAGEQDIANASHVAGLALESSLGTPFSTPNASDNISGTQSHAPSPAPSSSNPSSSVLKESDYTKNINTAVGSVDTSNVDADLNDISDYISQYLAFIQGKMTKPSQTNVAKRDWPGSKCLFKLKEVVGQGGEAVKAVCPDAKTIAQRSLQGLGVMHMLTTGFLVVANIMERYETISHNKEVCLSLLEGMNTLVQYVKQLQERLGLKEGMKTKIEKAIKLIIEVSLACCTQIDKPKYIQFFSTAVNQEEMVDFKKKLTALYNEIHLQMGIHLQDGIEKIDIRLRKEPSYPQYPREAFGIEKRVEKVIELLEWESDKTAVAVILHGLGGMGKTTLADAVFATLRDKKMEGCKYSFVRLFDNIASVPNIPKLQTCILRDLKMGEASAIPEIRRYDEGQKEIALMLEKKKAFIYIDNVLLPDKVGQGRDAIEQLLPMNMGNAKKLRLLITTQDKGAGDRVCQERRFYPIETLPDREAMRLAKKILDGGEKQIDSTQINHIVQICGGIPRLLMEVAQSIRSAKNIREAQDKCKAESIVKEIDRYVFAYEYLDEILRDPFLDICSYFEGWQWEELSNIVGDFELNSLENRALVIKDVKSMTARVHNVILAIGLQRTEGERFKFTSASKFQDFLDTKEDEDLRGIKGIWSVDNSCLFDIPASKLDLMCRSLRVLALGNSTEVEGRCNKTFEELFFFSAGISHLPFVLSKLKKLRHLCYSPEDLQNLSQMPSNLRHIDIQLKSPAFAISPTCIRQLSNLRVLRLRNAQLKRFPQELGDLVDGLQELTLLNCEHLEELPQSISTLEYLRVLKMDPCSSLMQPPKDFGSWNSLQELQLRKCESLEELPNSFEKLTSLQKLDLFRCERLKALPESVGQLKLLDSINLSLTDLKELPDGFCSLSSITELAMDNCRRLEKLPDRFGEVTSLRKLSLVNCNSLKKLPESFSQLKYLEDLNLSGCVTLAELCTDFESLSSLRFLSLETCRMLEKLPQNFHGLPSLEHLYLSDCDKLEMTSMDSIVKMETLQIVDIQRSPLLYEVWQTIEELCNQWSDKVVHSRQGSSSNDHDSVELDENM